MAGSSNIFLTPSHFTQAGPNILQEEPRIDVLIPPSSYENVPEKIVKQKPDKMKAKEVVALEMENLELKQKIEKLLEQNRVLYRDKEKDIVRKSKREMAVESELQLAQRKICDLEQEKEILQYELQDKESLSGVVLKLKKDLRKAKERVLMKEKDMNESVQEYCDVIEELKSKQMENKKSEKHYVEEISNLTENCSKQEFHIKQLEEKYFELEKILETHQTEFVKMLDEKENEKNEISEKLARGQKISRNNLEELQERNEKLNKEIGKMEELNKEKEKEKELVEHGRKEFESEMKRVESELLKEKEKYFHLENDIVAKDCKIAELEETLKKKEDDLNRMDVEYKNRIVAMETEYKLNIGKLEEMIQSKDDVIERGQRLYNEKIQTKEDEIKELSQTIEQLRSYIGEVRPSQESEKLNETNKQLTRTLDILTEENNTLHSTVKLLNVRLSAILEIVALQENELTRNENVFGNTRGNQRLLRKWREKVFALMVQLRSQKIVEENEKREQKAKIDNLNNKLENLQRECSVLDHQLTDKQAAFELETNLKRTTEQELGKLKEEAKVLRNQQNQCLGQLQSLHNMAHDVKKTMVKSLTNIAKSVNKMLAFEERIKFAGCRIHFIAGYLNHRDSNMKKDDKEKSRDGDDSCVEISPNDEEHLKEEVAKLHKERDLLLNETKKHNNILEEKTALITEQYETIMREKNEKLRKLEESELETREKLSQLKDCLEVKNEELEEALEKIEELKLALNKEKNALEKAHREAFEKERLQNVEDMRSIEGQLNDVRREHGKAVLALQNAERQLTREKEQSSKMVANIERELNEKLMRCQRQLNNVEKERNLLMVRIKEDKKNVQRIPPVQRSEHTKRKGDLSQKEQVDSQKSKSGEPNLSNKTRVSVGDIGSNEGERVQCMGPNEALVTLKELKMLSEQIIKIQENSVSDSEK